MSYYDPVVLSVSSDQMEFEAAQKVEAAQMNGKFDQSEVT